MNNKRGIFMTMGLCFALLLHTHAQSAISGRITDQETNEGLAGALVALEDKINNATTDANGEFTLFTSESPPFDVEISLTGFQNRTFRIIAADQTINVALTPIQVTGSEVVVSASRVEESILTSPISIEKLDGIEIRSTPNADAYSTLANLKGVQANTSSLTYISINTRGFADLQNWRFVQLIDGVEMNAPGLNYPAGTLSSPSDIDLLSMELVPGAGSALYGANAFNGMLFINTKSPFTHQGLSAEIKAGGTFQQGVQPNPFGELNLRYAKSFNNKFAIKIAGSALRVRDWESNDTSFYITNEIASAGLADRYINTPSSSPNYNAVNRYGDEVTTMVNLGDTSMLVNRTGINERDIVNYNQQIYKLNLALHYRLNENVELSYDGRFVDGDAILRHTSIYPIVNFWHQIHKLEAKGRHFFARAYASLESSGDSYFMLGTGAYIEKGLKSNTAWGNDYGAAYRGEIAGITAHDHAAARTYADRDRPDPSSAEFQRLRTESLTNSNFAQGGAKIVDRTSFLHAEGNYDFSHLFDKLPIQAGGSVRRYNLVSNGQLFNDGTLGYNQAIGVLEYGSYAQASKTLWKERINLRASVRYDKNQNFKGRITPRGSVVVSVGRLKMHNFRASVQTGFRNPATQETYIALDLGQGILLGGVQSNIEHFNYRLSSNNPLTGDTAGTIINGVTIHENLVTLQSFGQYMATHDPNRLQYVRPAYLRQEHVTAFEIGYKTLIKNKLYIDANYYYNIYKDFVSRVSAFNINTMRAFSVYTNVSDVITSQGFGANVEYELPRNFRIGVNYTYTTYNADSAIAHNQGFLPSFNTPKHRVNISLSNRNVWRNVGFNLKYRWSDSYVWQSPFGQGNIHAYQVVDAAISYRVPAMPVAIKLGGTNLLGNGYRQVYGGPLVGTQAYISIQFDPVAYPTAKSKASKPVKPKKGDSDKNLHGYERF